MRNTLRLFRMLPGREERQSSDYYIIKTISYVYVFRTLHIADSLVIVYFELYIFIQRVDSGRNTLALLLIRFLLIVCKYVEIPNNDIRLKRNRVDSRNSYGAPDMSQGNGWLSIVLKRHACIYTDNIRSRAYIYSDIGNSLTYCATVDKKERKKNSSSNSMHTCIGAEQKNFTHFTNGNRLIEFEMRFIDIEMKQRHNNVFRLPFHRIQIALILKIMLIEIVSVYVTISLSFVSS